MPALRFHAPITSGKLPEAVSKAIRAVLPSFEGKVVEITLERFVRVRSSNQNRFYWRYVLPCVVGILESYGNDADTDMAHDVCKHMFLPSGGRIYLAGKDGKPMHHMLTSTKLTTAEWENYIDRIRVWCAEEGVQVPFPGEQLTTH